MPPARSAADPLVLSFAVLGDGLVVQTIRHLLAVSEPPLSLEHHFCPTPRQALDQICPRRDSRFGPWES